MQIDPTTLFVVLIFSNTFLAIFMVFYQSTRETYAGFVMWVWATVITGLGSVLLGFRGVLPMALSILAGNTAFPAGAVCLLGGTKRFLGLPAPSKTLWAVPLIVLLGLGFFYWVYDIPAARGVVMSLGLALVCLPTAWLLWRHAPANSRALYFFTALMLAILGIALPVRSILWLLLDPQARLFTRHASQTIYLLIAIFTQIGWTLGFVMMNGQRLENDLRASRAELAVANEELGKALGEVRQLNAEFRDSLIKEQKAKSELKEQRNLLSAFWDTVPIPLFYKDAQGIYQNANDAFFNYMGMNRKDVIGKTATDITTMHDVETTIKMDNLLLTTGEKQEYETQFLYNDGLRHEVIVNKAVFSNADGEVAGIIAAITDITERKIQEAKIEHIALHDQLTGLYNRNMFYNYLEKALVKAKRHEQRVALFYLDLDGFKKINDTLGHNTGDMVLKSVSNRIVSQVRESDMVCRMGGDEFTILVEMASCPKDMAEIAGKTIKAISQPIIIKKDECRVGASVGIAFYPDNATDPQNLIKKADKAMYEAKRQGKGVYCFYKQ